MKIINSIVQNTEFLGSGQNISIHLLFLTLFLLLLKKKKKKEKRRSFIPLMFHTHTHVLALFANLYSLTCSLITESVIQSLASSLGEYSSYCVFIKFKITHVFAHTFPLIVSAVMFNNC